MSKHTPGPWHVNRKHPTKVNGPEAAPGVLLDAGENVGVTEGIANAKLIAAATDLLAACMEAWQYGHDEPWMASVCAAIAKATGEQP